MDPLSAQVSAECDANGDGHANGNGNGKGMAPEHGKVSDIVHSHTVHGIGHGKARMGSLWHARPPLLQASKSHGHLPGLSHGHSLPHFGHHPFHNSVHPTRIPSVTHSQSRSEQMGHIPIRPMHSDIDIDDEDELDTMYGDEDNHHQRLYSALDDLDEDPQEYNLNDAMLSESPLRNSKGAVASRSLADLTQIALTGDAGEEKEEAEEEKEEKKTKLKPMRRSRTWGKLNSMFRHKDAHTEAKGKGKEKEIVLSVSPAPRLRTSHEEADDEGDGDDEEERPLKRRSASLTSAHAND